MKHIRLITAFLLVCQLTSAQNKAGQLFGEPILTDSSSTIFIPVRYNNEFLSANKIALWGDYYANITVYDFVHDQYHRLFPSDIYVEAFRDPGVYRSTPYDKTSSLIIGDYVFLFVKDQDYNRSGRVDEKDPTALYVVTRQGKDLKRLTGPTEHVVSLRLFQNEFVLLGMQKDSNNDQSFKNEAFYYVKLDLKDLSFGAPIVIR